MKCFFCHVCIELGDLHHHRSEFRAHSVATASDRSDYGRRNHVLGDGLGVLVYAGATEHEVSAAGLLAVVGGHRQYAGGGHCRAQILQVSGKQFRVRRNCLR